VAKTPAVQALRREPKKGQTEKERLRGIHGGAPHSAHEIERLIHERLRLGIISALAVTDSLTFNELKQTVKTKPGPRAQIAPDRPSRSEAEDAVRTLIRWAGDNPSRPGMAGTPARVVRAYEEWFSGYAQDPREYLSRTFDEVAGYDEVVVLRDISFESHCEHHLAPIIGRVHIGYLPRNRVVGISKLARLVDVYAKRFQIQEKMTAEIAGCLESVLKPFGVAVVVEAAHQCMTTRGVHKLGVTMVTSQMLGVFRKRLETRHEFLSAINLRGAAPL